MSRSLRRREGLSTECHDIHASAAVTMATSGTFKAITWTPTATNDLLHGKAPEVQAVGQVSVPGSPSEVRRALEADCQDHVGEHCPGDPVRNTGDSREGQCVRRGEGEGGPQLERPGPPFMGRAKECSRSEERADLGNRGDASVVHEGYLRGGQ